MTKQSRRIWWIIGGAALLLSLIIVIAGGSSGKKTADSTTTTAATASTATTAPSAGAAVAAWYQSIQPQWKPFKADLSSMTNDAKAQNFSGLSAACSQLTTDAQALQTQPPAPDPTVNTPFQAALTGFAKAGQQCALAVQNQSGTQLEQMTVTLTAANSQLAQAVGAVNQLTGAS